MAPPRPGSARLRRSSPSRMSLLSADRRLSHSASLPASRAITWTVLRAAGSLSSGGRRSGRDGAMAGRGGAARMLMTPSALTDRSRPEPRSSCRTASAGSRRPRTAGAVRPRTRPAGAMMMAPSGATGTAEPVARGWRARRRPGPGAAWTTVGVRPRASIVAAVADRGPRAPTRRLTGHEAPARVSNRRRPGSGRRDRPRPGAPAGRAAARPRSGRPGRRRRRR